MDLATYGNFVNSKGATASFTGDHKVKNMENAEKGNVLLNDHKKGEATKIDNFMNAGNLKVSGDHVIDNIKNTDTAKLFAEDRKFVLLDLATFGNLVNAKGSTMSMTGDN